MAIKTHQLRLTVCSTNGLSANPTIVAVTIQTSETLRRTRPRLLMYSLIVMASHATVWAQLRRQRVASDRPTPHLPVTTEAVWKRGINPAIFNSDKAHPRKVNRIEPQRDFLARSIRLIRPSMVFTQPRPTPGIRECRLQRRSLDRPAAPGLVRRVFLRLPTSRLALRLTSSNSSRMAAITG
jgi:hypothetical protein